MRENEMGDEVYQPDGSEVQDDAGLLEPEDTLDYHGVDQILDEGYSPPERPWAVNKPATTAAGRLRGETLDERLAEELPDLPIPDGDGIGDTWDTDGELIDGEVGGPRAGRLLAPDEGTHYDTDGMVAQDIGIDGAAASAEEAAMHLLPESEEY